MKKINYRLVQERVYLAIALIKLAQEILTLLNMAFNYLTNKNMHEESFPAMVI